MIPMEQQHTAAPILQINNKRGRLGHTLKVSGEGSDKEPGGALGRRALNDRPALKNCSDHRRPPPPPPPRTSSGEAARAGDGDGKGGGGPSSDAVLGGKGGGRGRGA